LAVVPALSVFTTAESAGGVVEDPPLQAARKYRDGIIRNKRAIVLMANILLKVGRVRK
jgi:hypothetical protein